jgi:hypothetical protein
MNPTRQSKLEDLETIRRTQAQQKNLSTDAQIEVKLGLLRAFIEQLAQTPQGKADLASRTRAFGSCLRMTGESNRRYYGRLRRWLDADLLAATSK